MVRRSVLSTLLCVAALAVSAEEPAGAVVPPAGGVEPLVPQRILGRSVEEWVKHLETRETERERKLAMTCLMDFGPAAAAAVPELIRLCKDEIQPDTPRWAAETLGTIRLEARAAVPELSAAVKAIAKPASFRAAACVALSRIDPQSSAVRKALLAACRDENGEVRQAALDALVPLAPFEPEAVERLYRALSNEEDAAVAARALRCLGAEGAEQLAKAIDKGGATARVAAGEALAQMEEEAAPALPLIVKQLKRQKDRDVRSALLLAASRIAPKDPVVLEALVANVVAGGRSIGEIAGAPPAQPYDMEIRALTAAGLDAVPALRAGLQARDAAVRRQAVLILGKLAQPPGDVVDDLVARAQDSDAGVRTAAIKALDGFGPAAAKAHGALLEIAAHDQPLSRVAQLAAFNVARSADKPRRRSLLETRPDAEIIAALENRDPAVRLEAAEALRSRTADARRIADALIVALGDGNAEVRIAAAHSLVRFGRRALGGLPTFTAWLDQASQKEEDAPDLAPCKAALAALAGVGPDAKAALPAILRVALSALPERNADVRGLLGTVLRIIGPDAAVPLVAQFKNASPVVRARAARAVAAMGAVGAMAAPEFLELSKSAVDSDAEAGCAGLEAIGPVAYQLAGAQLATMVHGDVFSSRRRWAAAAIGSIGIGEGDPARALDALLLALLDPDESVCRAAHDALVKIGAPALPKMRQLFKLGDTEIPPWALRAFVSMKADPAEVIPRLTELSMPGKRPAERATAAELLGGYAPGHVEAMPPLLRLLGDRDDAVARAAIRALAPFGEQAAARIPGLLRDSNPLVRRRAIEARQAWTAQRAKGGA
jgi:HEAT repeat protein